MHGFQLGSSGVSGPPPVTSMAEESRAPRPEFAPPTPLPNVAGAAPVPLSSVVVVGGVGFVVLVDDVDVVDVEVVFFFGFVFGFGFWVPLIIFAFVFIFVFTLALAFPFAFDFDFGGVVTGSVRFIIFVSSSAGARPSVS